MRAPRILGRRQWTARRLFAAYAAVTLVPVVLLGFLLTELLRSQADEHGLADGVNRAQLIAQSAIIPLLDQSSTTSMTRGEYAQLERVARELRSERQVLRLRLRNLSGAVVFPVSGASLGPDDDARAAARGRTVRELTRLNADEPGQRLGPRVVEVYLPLDVANGARIGVLEMYVPYTPIARDIARGQRTVLVALSAGLALLWLCLIGVTASVIRHLRRETRANAHLAAHDALTGLPNRSRLDGLFASLAADEAAVVAILNVDRFRKVRDALGSRNSDIVLVTLAHRLRDFCADTGIVARLEGTDFAVVGVGAAVDDPEAWLQRVRAAARELVDVEGLPVAIEVTAGYDVCTAEEAATSDGRTDVLARAAIALSAAKRAACGLLRYAPEQNLHDATALGLVAGMGAAIEADELVLHFQPKYDVRTGRASSVEALVRWQHPVRGLLPPAAFLDAVEETELVDVLTCWVLRHACRAAGRLGPDMRVAVNVSARSLVQLDFPDDVIEVVRAEGIDPGRIILEVTETAVITDPLRARVTLSRLRAAGFAISIDDFGVGQTSLSHLVAMPIDELKIDRTFVHDMLTNDRSTAVVRAVIELGHSLGISVTAEGVETEQVLSVLGDLGCDVAQGYFFSRPVPLPELLDMLGSPVDDAALTPA